MDVNGTHFHLRLGRRDWEPVIERASARLDHVLRWQSDLAPLSTPFRPVRWDEDWSSVSLTRRVPRFQPPRGTRVLAAADRRGASADSYGNVYWIGDDRARIRVQPGGVTASGDYWSLSDLAASCRADTGGLFQPAEAPAPTPLPLLRGLTVTTTHYLIVGTLAPGGVLLFDLHGPGAPWWWRWPEALNFQPFDLSATPDGGVLVLDRDVASGEARLWRLDRHFQAVGMDAPLEIAPAERADFHPEGGAVGERPPVLFADPVTLAAASPLAVEQPIGAVALPDHTVLVVDAGQLGQPSRIDRYRGTQRLSTHPLDAEATQPALGESITGVHAFAVVTTTDSAPGTCSGWLYLVTISGTQAFVLRFSADGDELTIRLEPTALPMQRYTGKGLVSAPAALLYDVGDHWIGLAEQPRYEYFDQAVLGGQPLVFDGKDAGCVWHRLLLDACIPAGCRVLLRSRTADERDALDTAPWRNEIAPVRRAEGSELPFDRPFGALARTDSHSGTFETLFQEAFGRYLELEIELHGDGRASPRLRALRVYYPRFSYVQEYLPAVYREDALSASFLDRYLANPEGTFTAIEGRIERAETLLDPNTTPPEYLDWLAGWLGALNDPSWDEARKRLFLRHAWLLFKWRGTALALVAFLELATERCPDDSIFVPLQEERRRCAATYGSAKPRIVENFELRSFPALLPREGLAASQPALLAEGKAWDPARGGQDLHARFAEFLYCRYSEGGDVSEQAALDRLNAAWALPVPSTDFAQLHFSAVRPASEATARDWEAFAAATFAFPYPDVRSEDNAYWRDFLARRYAQVDALNQAWGRSGSARWTSFASLPLPAADEFPADGAPLTDWLQFVSLALPIQRNAHRFTVLVPALTGEAPEERENRRKRVTAIVAVEKPAHTDFDAKLFWALFQVGIARLGIDSALGESGRFVAMVLDTGYLGQAYLAEGHPWNVTDRRVIGRDSLRG